MLSSSSLASLRLERRWLHQAFQVQAWASAMEILECPVTRIPLSTLLAGSDGKASRYGRYQCSCRSCRKVLQCLTIRLRGSIPDFLSGFTPLAFDQPRPTCKAAGDSFCYLTQSWDPYRCYNPGSGWTWEQWWLRSGSTLSKTTGLPKWSLTTGCSFKSYLL